MADFLTAAVSADPDAPALVDAHRSWSYGELHDEVTRWARALRTRGARPGVRVATLLPTSARAVVAAHAVFETGAVLAPLSPRLSPDERARALDALDPELVLVEGAEAAGEGTAEDPPTDAPNAVDVGSLTGTADTPGTSHAGGEDEPARPEPNDPAAVLWTSGTAGRPRGVLLSSEALRASAEASRTRLRLGPDDRWYVSLSMAHVGGLALVVRAAVLGSALVTRGEFDVSEATALIEGGEISHASLVPTMLHRLVRAWGDRAPPPSLRVVLVGGAPLPRPALEQALAAGWPVALTYGLTEATSQVATAPPSRVREKPGTVGRPLGGVEIRLDEAGEILVRGATLSLGYLHAEEPLLDSDGWHHTGDLGELDADGDLWITGRTTDRIITGGVNVDPVEVEEVLRTHEGVREVVVVGVPDREWGERVAAAVVRAPGVYTEPTELQALARERLTSAKLPRTVVFMDEVPLNPNGKVDRAEVRRRIVQAAG